MRVVDSSSEEAVRSPASMRPLALAAGALAALILLVLPFHSAAGDGRSRGVELDGGCRVRLDANPTSGFGCHVHFSEPAVDGGEPVEGLAAVPCNGTFLVCGEVVRCHCPEW